MSELSFAVRRAEPLRAAAAPAIALQLDLSNNPPEQAIQSILLNCQIQIEAERRRYQATEQARLRDLFGEPERWSQTLHPFLWTNLTTTVPGFTGSIGITLAVPCTLDLCVAASKYFHAIEEGSIPIVLLFSGTVFYRNELNLLQAAPISWNAQARFPLPAGIWKECMDLHHPNMAWLALRRDVFERLNEFRSEQGLATFDHALERMLEEVGKVSV